MSTWIKLDEGRLNAPEVKSSRGVSLAISLSAFDIPEAVRGFEEPETGWFCIQFRYLDSEDGINRQVSETMIIEEGRSSGRIQAIRVNTKKLKVSNVRLGLRVQMKREISDGLKKFFSLRKGELASRRRGVADRILNENSRDILETLSANASS